jgi:serine/threonine-protein kinase
MMLTQQGMVFGTPEFMSPEQTQGDTLDRRSDIYSLGLIFYELITGKLPFDATKPVDIMRAHVQQEPLPLTGRAAGRSFSDALEQVVRKALAKKRDDRYATALDFADALKGCLGSNPGAGPAGSAGPAAPVASGAGGTAPAGSTAVGRNAPSAAVSAPPAVHVAHGMTEPPTIPRTKAPLLAIAFGVGLLLLVIGVWVGSSLGR